MKLGYLSACTRALRKCWGARLAGSCGVTPSQRASAAAHAPPRLDRSYITPKPRLAPPRSAIPPLRQPQAVTLLDRGTFLPPTPQPRKITFFFNCRMLSSSSSSFINSARFTLHTDREISAQEYIRSFFSTFRVLETLIFFVFEFLLCKIGNSETKNPFRNINRTLSNLSKFYINYFSGKFMATQGRAKFQKFVGFEHKFFLNWLKNRESA